MDQLFTGTGPAGYFQAVALPEPDLFAATREFVRACALPALAPECIISGWSALEELPVDAEEFAVLQVLRSEQQGRTKETFRASGDDPEGSGALLLRGLFSVAMRVVFCGGDLARQRAQRCALTAGCGSGALFFAERGCSALHADPVRAQCRPGTGPNAPECYGTTLYLSVWAGIDVALESHDTVRLARLELVDAHHSPAAGIHRPGGR